MHIVLPQDKRLDIDMSTGCCMGHEVDNWRGKLRDGSEACDTRLGEMNNPALLVHLCWSPIGNYLTYRAVLSLELGNAFNWQHL